LISLLSFYHKKDSTLGRMLIYKISYKILADNFLTGIGIGNFKHTYLLYQAEYFKTEAYTQKELLLADNNYFAFNDYFEFVIECGVSGLLGLTIFFLFLLRKYRVLLKNKSGFSLLCLISSSQLITLLVSALFTHVFENTFFLSITVVLIILFIHCTNPRLFNNFSLIFLIFFSVVSLVGYRHFDYLHHYPAYKKFDEAKLLNNAGYKNESLKDLKDLYQKLEGDKEFLRYYSERLFEAGDVPQAKQVLTKAILKLKDNNLYTLLGECLAVEKDYKGAEKNLLLAVYMVPNRHRNRQVLFNFYQQVNLTSKAAICGRDIVRLPIKIESPQVHKIKQDVAKELRSLIK